MTIAINDVLDRVQQLGVDALANLSTPVTAYGVSYMYRTQSQFPYFAAFVQNWQDAGDSFEIRDVTVNIALRLIVGNRDEGAPGDMETNLYTWMFAIPRYINQRISLKTSTDTSDVADLMYAQCLGGQGTQFFETSNVGVATVGTTFIVECHFTEIISQSAF